ncbi:Na/Pi cotransporter family protein [Verrucomicrobiaceae bacterium N1E253]|uniref:Na/Pi cotransporter family protein n=1 Tax=Oceaniferula marina TaxID=2748318 RepID=A0A851GH29_9BACT|nr:Na/Pi cotransporter family protein [Oceaniferula marina]NWK56499.1 Na/Pi cotransporter family protein [Oceaniferula marina]
MALILADITTNTELDLLPILIGMLGGLALFLFGMEQMSTALKAIAGDGLRKILAKLTTNRFTGAAAGAIVTSIIQSSSVTTVLVVGFISAGLMNFSQSIGIIMGANVGTTMTAQIIAFKVTKYALLLIGTGFSLSFFFKNERLKHYGNMIMGLGLIFYGMQLMGDSTAPLQTFAPFIDFMKNMDSPLMGIAFGALFTALVQSSSATTGIVIVLATQGFLSLDAGIALIFGANIGTCFTAWLASLGKSIEAKRAVAVHIIFNIAGVVLWFFFIPQLAEVVRNISPQAAALEKTARLAAETPRQIANAHTIFNVTNTFVFIWLVHPLARFILRLIPDAPASPDKQDKTYEPKYLDESQLQTPALALESIRLELIRMGSSTLNITHKAIDTVIRGDEQAMKNLRDMDNIVDSLHAAILSYLGKLSSQALDEKQAAAMHRYLSAANYLENIGDMVETNLVEAGYDRLETGLQISQATQDVLAHFHTEVSESVKQAIDALVDNDHHIASEVIHAKPHISHLANEAEKHLSRRLTAKEPQRVVAFHLESEIIEHLKRMYYFAKRIAKLVDTE